MTEPTLRTEIRGRVGILTLDRPQALNALNLQLMGEITAAASAFDDDPGIGCIVITGSDKAFAAGADIREMQNLSYMEMHRSNWFAGWDALGRVRTPVIAAVSGYALGGGCELAMMCDFILASDTAKFGQPEIKLGVIPGMGGSQRLTRLVGKAKAMEMCLTGRMIDAAEAERAGLVARIVPGGGLLDDAIATATTIAAMSAPVAMMVKQAVNVAYETTLAEGLRFERQVFHAAFATEDQKEGMAAFAEKRAPRFGNR